MTDHDIELLERFVDDELSSEEAAAVERQIAEDATWAAAHRELLALRALLQDDVEAAADAVDFGGFFAAIEARLPAESPALAASARPTATSANPAEPGLWARLREWWGKHWTPILVGVAVAAAVAFWITRPTESGAPDRDGDLVAERVDGVEPVIVDAVTNEGDKTVLISMPADEDGSTVIWLIDEEQDEPEPVEGEDPI